MNIRSLHEWDVDASHAMEIQNRLSDQISLKDPSNFKGLRRVSGADVSYAPGKEILYGGVVVLSFPGLEVVEEKWVDRVSLRTAIRLVLATSRGYRLPEPTRLAHQLVNRVRREGR